MPVNRRKLAALLVGLLATAAVAGTAAASHNEHAGGDEAPDRDRRHVPVHRPGRALQDDPVGRAGVLRLRQREDHGVNGRKIKDITIDDSYNPAQTVPAVKKLVEQDHVFAIVGSLGTAPGLATWKYLNQHKVPQVLLATGDAYWGNCVHHACAGLAEAVDDGLAAGLPG